jgi:cytochrome c oxidase subunit 3
MLLFIGSEIMLFGSFFAAYFFVRVANPSAPAEWPPPPFEFPVFVAGVNTCILVTSSFTMHWALQSIKRGERTAFLGGWSSRSSWVSPSSARRSSSTSTSASTPATGRLRPSSSA